MSINTLERTAQEAATSDRCLSEGGEGRCNPPPTIISKREPVGLK